VANIPDEYKPIAALVIGAFVLVFIALFHGVGLHWILVMQNRGERRLRVAKPRLVAVVFLFAWSVFLMLDLHLVEVLIWSFALGCMGLINHASDAIYFCANSYTTLGMGKVDVDSHWRIISPIIGISGLFTFAWTTSALVDVVASNRRLLNLLEDEREEELRMRFAMRKAQWDAVKTEGTAERAEQEKARGLAAGSSLSQRLKIWRDERKIVAELRKQKVAEIEDLRRQERLQEKEIRPKPADAGPDGGSNNKEQK
jgi:hypothetical protein